MKEFIRNNRISVSLAIFVLVIMPGIFFGAQWISERVDAKKQIIAENELARQVRSEQIGSISTFAQQEELIATKGEVLSIFLENSDEAKVRLADRIDAIAREENLVLQIDAQKEVLSAKDDKKDDKKDDTKKSVTDGRTGASSAAAPQASAAAEAQEVVAPAGENYLTLTITTFGTFSEVTRFLHKMEHMEYFNDVLGVNVKKRSTRQAVRRVRSEQEDDAPVEKENAVDAVISIVFYLTPSS